MYYFVRCSAIYIAIPHQNIALKSCFKKKEKNSLRCKDFFILISRKLHLLYQCVI